MSRRLVNCIEDQREFFVFYLWSARWTWTYCPDHRKQSFCYQSVLGTDKASVSAFRRTCFPFICETCVRENNSAVSICPAGDLPSWFGRLRVSNFYFCFLWGAVKKFSFSLQLKSFWSYLEGYLLVHLWATFSIAGFFGVFFVDRPVGVLSDHLYFYLFSQNSHLPRFVFWAKSEGGAFGE